MRRRFRIILLVIAGLAGVSASAYAIYNRPKPKIRVGLLHSRTGTMAVSELPMLNGEILALEELNEKGGLLGREIEWVIADGRSDPRTFAEEAARLIDVEKVSVIFGCWTSACRRTIVPIVEKADHLLIYPVAYEGLESSPNVYHTGAAPNQQIVPAISYARKELKAKSFFMVGTSSIWSRTLNEIVKDQLKCLQGTVSGEVYVGANVKDHEAAVDAILKAKPDVVLNSLEGDANGLFFRKLKEKGVRLADLPVLSFAVNEDEARELASADISGSYSVGSYFQSIDRAENHAFVGRFQSKYGRNSVTSDAICSAYNSIMLWSQAVIDAETEKTAAVRTYLGYQSYDAPEGIVSIDRDNFHTWRSFFVGKVQSDGKINIVWRLSKPTRPTPYPLFRSKAEWNDYLNKQYEAWSGHWNAPDGKG